MVGSAILAATAEGRFSDLREGAAAFVRYSPEVRPDPAWGEAYSRMQPVFEKIYRHSQALYEELDRLA